MPYIILAVLIILDGYFSLAEIALIAVKRGDLNDEVIKGDMRASKVLELIKNPDDFMSAITVGSTLLSLMEGIYGGGIIAIPLEKLLVHVGFPLFVTHIVAITVGIGIITYVTIVFGELVPKSIAFQMPLRASLAIAPSLTWFSKIAYPFIKLLTVSTRWILSFLKIKKNDKKITEKDLQELLSTVYKQGGLGLLQLRMYENLSTFSHLTAGRIMKPARIVASIAVDSTAADVRTYIKHWPYTYLPVYKNDKKNVIGIIDTKQFLIKDEPNWQDLIFTPCTLQTEMPAEEIFTAFRDKKTYFAIVRNDNKEFLGVLAMQDIMEGVFGDIPEHETYKDYFYQINEKQWFAEGFIHLQRIRKQLNLPWLRTYEHKYLSVSELIKGECLHLDNKNNLILNGVVFEMTGGSATDPENVRITLP